MSVYLCPLCSHHRATVKRNKDGTHHVECLQCKHKGAADKDPRHAQRLWESCAIPDRRKKH